MTTQQLRWYGVPEGEARKLSKRYKVMPSGVVDKLMAGKITHCGGLEKYHKETP